MKITEVEIGVDYVLKGTWSQERDRVTTLGIETVETRGNYGQARNERRVRVRYVEVAPRTWGQSPKVGEEVRVEARRLEEKWEPYAERRDARRAEDAKGDEVGARIEAVLERLGIEPDVERIRGSAVYLTFPYEQATKLAAALEAALLALYTDPA